MMIMLEKANNFVSILCMAGGNKHKWARKSPTARSNALELKKSSSLSSNHGAPAKIVPFHTTFCKKKHYFLTISARYLRKNACTAFLLYPTTIGQKTEWYHHKT